jgi:hypothetical protein
MGVANKAYAPNFVFTLAGVNRTVNPTWCVWRVCVCIWPRVCRVCVLTPRRSVAATAVLRCAVLCRYGMRIGSSAESQAKRTLRKGTRQTLNIYMACE